MARVQDETAYLKMEDLPERPDLPPWSLCGGAKAPYRQGGPVSQDSASPTESSEPAAGPPSDSDSAPPTI